MALIHCVFAVSPPALMRIAVKEHACQAAKIDDTVSGGCCEAFLCLLIFPHSSVFLLQALRACASSSSKTPLHIFPFLNSLFTFLVSPSPMLLFLHSQVASRVRAGFVGAHARKRDSATDLIAEKRRQEEEKQRAMETEMMQREM